MSNGKWFMLTNRFGAKSQLVISGKCTHRGRSNYLDRRSSKQGYRQLRRVGSLNGNPYSEAGLRRRSSDHATGCRSFPLLRVAICADAHTRGVCVLRAAIVGKNR